ncbi:MAG TPA: ATP-binding cassette domain-containing protein [Streptosporangiaceae bacterium]|nr:ATP-binding cassette domain-containing protein [Streptosporangiaceae bacterium]
MAQIILDHVDKTYAGGVKAIDDLSLDVKDGEFMAFVGPSGCGKSTALRSIAGLEEITAGKIQIGDRVVNDLPPKDRDIAMVFQNYALYPHMTVEQNLAFGLQLRKTPKDEIKRRVDDAAKMLGLEQYLNRKPVALSGGQRQRVAMGRAIVREPQAFLMDEPLSNLDAKQGLSDYIGKKVILGIRPSDFEDASLSDSQWAKIQVTSSVIEELGTEIHAIFTIDAPPVEHASPTKAADNEDEDDSVAALAGGKSLWTARVSARSRVRPGQPIELGVDTHHLHFFDPNSGLSIGHPKATAGLAEQPA